MERDSGQDDNEIYTKSGVYFMTLYQYQYLNFNNYTAITFDVNKKSK